METVTDKFLRYVSFETTSDENSTTHPSNLLEVKLSEQLVKEMKAIGITDAAVDENGYVMGTIPS
ncbi:MAG: peptidase T, partial [Bacteroidales bacterium]|nr:peptidase T [Bacteroidales bacterium]